MTAILVALGGAVGALLRWTVMTRARSGGATPAGATLLVNVAGSLLLGLVAGWSARPGAPGWALPLLGGGLCGALTTYGTHALEVVQAWRDREPRHALVNLTLSPVLCLAVAALGWWVAT